MPRPLDPPARPHEPPMISRSARGVVALREAALFVQDLETRLAFAKSEVKRLEEVELPAAFTEDGISQLQLPDGQQARRAVDILGSLPSEDEHPAERENALTWLADNGYPDVIRCQVVSDFGQENREAALELYERLRTSNVAHITKKETVHPMTLKALIRQRINADPPQQTPIEELGCVVIRRVKLTTPPRARAADAMARPSRPTPSAPIEPEDQ